MRGILRPDGHQHLASLGRYVRLGEQVSARVTAEANRAAAAAPAGQTAGRQPRTVCLRSSLFARWYPGLVMSVLARAGREVLARRPT
jgi:hypothetical protein